MAGCRGGWWVCRLRTLLLQQSYIYFTNCSVISNHKTCAICVQKAYCHIYYHIWIFCRLLNLIFYVNWYIYVLSCRPAALAVISLAFGQYILEPLFMPCDIPPMAVKLATAIGISTYEDYCYVTILTCCGLLCKWHKLKACKCAVRGRGGGRAWHGKKT